MDALLPYALELTPWIALTAVAFLLVPRTAPLGRVAIGILGFLLVRDAMTEHGLWALGVADGVLWLRFIDAPVALLVMGALSAGLAAAICWGLGRDARRRMRFVGRSRLGSVLVGLGGAVIVVLPVLGIQWLADVPLAERGGAMSPTALVVLPLFALAGNALEEVLFRGGLQGTLDVPGWRGALASGTAFAAGHVMLATLVTDIGWPLVAFTLWEGIVCGFVWLRGGLVGSTLTHGLAIAVLASGLL